MTIESIELKNYRNYEELHMELSQGTNMHRERPISWRQFMCAALPSPTEGRKTGI